jgi:virulence factor Mce-like protein
VPYVADVSGRGPSTATLARRGVVALGLVVVVVAALLMKYNGDFRSVFPAAAVVADVGDGLQPGADVKLRGALVGRVGAVRVRPRPGVDRLPGHEIDLQLIPEMAQGIPAGVTARVVPTNIFGAPAVELLDPPDPTGRPRLTPGAIIAGDTSSRTLQLQTVLNQLTRVLRSVQPAKLDVALSNISAALRGRGLRVGDIIDRLDGYLSTLNARTPDFTADLTLFGQDLQALARTAPALLDTVDNVVVTSKTLVDKHAKLTATLIDARATASDAASFLDRAENPFVRLARDGARFAGVLAPQREFIPRSLASLMQGTELLGAGFDQKKGGLSLLFSFTPFTPYTARDCPRYPGLAGPNCGDRVPPPGAPPPSFPFYQRPPPPPPLLPTREPTREPARTGDGR